MKPERKREVIELVRRSPVTKKETLLELGMSLSTFYRWQRRYRSEGEAGLVDRRPHPGTIWNRLRPEESEIILVAARAEPEKSPREIACWISDHGPSYIAGAFEEYLRMHKMRHIRCSPHHPQTNGKLERFHETLKGRMNLLVWSSPEELRAAIADFIEFYNQRRYHEGIGNVAPADVYYGRRQEILKRREEQKRQTLYERFKYNRAQRSQTTRLLAAPNTIKPSVAPSATATTTTGEPDDSNRS